MNATLKYIALAALVVVCALAFWFFRPPSETAETETEPATEASAPDRDVRGTATPVRVDRETGTRPADPATAEADAAEEGGEQAPVDPAVVDAAGNAVPNDDRAAEYVHAPVEAMQTRIMEATSRLPEGRKIQGVTILCMTGGMDCRVTGVAPTPEDLKTFAETLEVTPASADEDAPPTVEVNSTESMSSGMTDFELGVYY